MSLPGIFGQQVCVGTLPAHGLGIPSSVLSWWETTGSPLVCTEKVQTLSLPSTIYAWWLANAHGNSVFLASPGSTVTVTEMATAVSSSSGTPSIAPASTTPSLSLPASTISSNESPSTQAPESTDDSSPVPTTTNSISSLFDTTETATTTESSSRITSASFSVAVGATESNQQMSLSSSLPVTSPSAIAGAASHNNNKTARIVAGVLVPLVVIALGIAAFIIYKRRRRVHDRREWERTHQEIADAVRQVGAATPAAVLATGPPAWGDVKPVPDNDSKAPLMDSSGGTPPGSLGHPNGSDHALLSHSHSRESSA
ncbi:hypothetical protein MSAN_00650800 [Mycena sanguinolenta]|uniref:Mid2 domain-containing protein n=1 Tax=Mycena sanguinolenta TaxID=230812 RepID=A0A8H6Z032_9AGAR|nr:hypothetical protein MSAN_00650800 [Mycena sanguinolenta]